MRCLLDTSAAYALVDSRDQHQGAAATFLRSGPHEFATTSIIIGESFTMVRRRMGFAVAERWVRLTHASERTQIVHLDEGSEAEIWDVIRRSAGIPLSYADASLVLLAQLTGIDTVFTFDEDFRDAGLKVVPGP